MKTTEEEIIEKLGKDKIYSLWFVVVVVVLAIVITLGAIRGRNSDTLLPENRPSLTSEPRASEEVEEFPEIEVIDGLDKG